MLYAIKINKLNFITSSTIYFRRFIRSSKITFKTKTLYNQLLLIKKGLLRLDIIFSDLNKYIIVYLKASKTNYNYKRVNIIISISNISICSIYALYYLFIEDS